MMAWTLSEDLFFTDCWKGGDHHLGSCEHMHQEEIVAGRRWELAHSRSGAITGCYSVSIGSTDSARLPAFKATQADWVKSRIRQQVESKTALSSRCGKRFHYAKV